MNRIGHSEDYHQFSDDEVITIQRKLLEWYDSNARTLPWRTAAKQADLSLNEKAYAVWVSEIMLQQTQVGTVEEYYCRWMDRWPTVTALANATEEDVNEMWKGLGYYRRARYLLKGAQHIVQQFGGVFPMKLAEVKTIPGVGDYTAGAICSIAYGHSEALVDGNVMRVLARARALDGDVAGKARVKAYWAIARDLVPADRPGEFNQALMELGATVCQPKRAMCDECPLSCCCLALAECRAHNPTPTPPSPSSRRKDSAKPLTPEIMGSIDQFFHTATKSSRVVGERNHRHLAVKEEKNEMNFEVAASTSTTQEEEEEEKKRSAVAVKGCCDDDTFGEYKDNSAIIAAKKPTETASSPGGDVVGREEKPGSPKTHPQGIATNASAPLPPCTLCENAGGLTETVCRYPAPKTLKAKRISPVHVAIVRAGHDYLLTRRPASGLLAGLWDFPQVPVEKNADQDERRGNAVRHLQLLGIPVDHDTLQRVGETNHIFSHIEQPMTVDLLEISLTSRQKQAVVSNSKAGKGPVPDTRWVREGEIQAKFGGAAISTCMLKCWNLLKSETTCTSSPKKGVKRKGKEGSKVSSAPKRPKNAITSFFKTAPN